MGDFRPRMTKKITSPDLKEKKLVEKKVREGTDG